MNYIKPKNTNIIQKAHILDKPKCICELLKLCKNAQSAITFDQFEIISELITNISQIKVDDRWTPWFLKFYRPRLSNGAAILEAQDAWHTSFRDLRLDWAKFVKSKFLTAEVLTGINADKIPKYHNIQTIIQEKPIKNCQKICH